MWSSTGFDSGASLFTIYLHCSFSWPDATVPVRAHRVKGWIVDQRWQEQSLVCWQRTSSSDNKRRGRPLYSSGQRHQSGHHGHSMLSLAWTSRPLLRRSALLTQLSSPCPPTPAKPATRLRQRIVELILRLLSGYFASHIVTARPRLAAET